MQLTFTRPRNQSLTHRAGSRAGRVRLFASRATDWSLNDDRIRVAPQPTKQGPAAEPFRSRMVGRLSKSQFRVEYERTCVVTAGDPIKRPLCLPRRSADGPTAQGRKRLEQRSTTIIKRPHAATSGLPKDADTCFKRLANPDQSTANPDPKFNTATRVETTHQICVGASAALEQD
jgi:hypothetical protein